MIIYEEGSRAARWSRLHKRLFHIVGPRLVHPRDGPRRLTNLLACEGSRRQGRLEHPGRPYVLFTEISSICQLQCPGCLSGQDGRHATFMELDRFRRLLDRFGPWLVDLELYGWGEPFLNRSIFEMIALAKSRNLFVRTSTNCNAFRQGDEARLVETGLDQLNCSLDGVTQGTYGAYRIGASLERSLEALRRLVDAKRRAGVRRPLIEWQMIISKKNQHEVEAVRTLARQAGVDILRLDLPFSLMHIDQADNPEATAEWIADDPKYRRWANAHTQGAWAFDCVCSYLWTTLQVDATGQINPCPNRLGSQIQLGDPLVEDVNTLWNQPFFTQARALFAPKAQPPAGHHPCMACKEFRQPWKLLPEVAA